VSGDLGQGGSHPRTSPPPAPRGNSRAVTHGAFAQSLVLPEVDALVAALMAEFDHLSERDYFAVRDLAISEVRVSRLAAWLEKNGDFDARNRLRPAHRELRHWLVRAERARARVGLDPASRLSLGVEEAASLEAIRKLLNQRADGAGDADTDEEAET
jgi:hypothetical protein